jgi:poly-gamma-glutamate capsule biosynthesis protein CapA/YwtB (metallophosphatase superfamily)
VDIVLTGDLVLDEPDADYWLSGIAPSIRAADLAIGHLEVPHTRRGTELKGDVPAPGAPPENLAAIRGAGFGIVSLGGNHIADLGAEGIADTIAELDRLGIAHAGAGANLLAARRPAIVQRGGRYIALLSYNCVGPEASWASYEQAGCAWLRVETSDGSPTAPAAPLTIMASEVPDVLARDIALARAEADLVLVALHKGIVHVPARLAPYERPLAWAAIDAGADAVIGHHAHIVRGIEFRRGRPIFHGMGNGCVVTSALSPAQDHPARRAWAERRRKMFGFEPDPAYTLAPFHPEAVNAMLGKLRWHADGRMEVFIVPVHIEPPGRPVLADEARAREIRDYISAITTAGGMNAIQIDANGLVQPAAGR